MIKTKIEDMKCPHCLVEFHDNPKDFDLGNDVDGDWGIRKMVCSSPNCKRNIFYLINGRWRRTPAGFLVSTIEKKNLIRPKAANRNPFPPEVPAMYLEDYNEAVIVLSDSPKASAALSRRCLQLLLRESAGVKPGNLSKEIQEVIESDQLPSHLSESIDAIRNIGNFAAHPSKYNTTGEIVPVEPGEAEWTLDVLEMLFDFYFVQPERTRLKREALNKKLEDMGKPEIK